METLSFSKEVSFKIRDISLERLYRVLFVYFELYSDYSFYIRRYPKFYELNFNARVGG